MRYGPPPSIARRIARLSGCRVVRTHHLHDGSCAFSIRCRNHRAKVRLLVNLAEYDAHTPDVRRAAELAVAGARTPEAQIAALHRRVRDGVTFTKEINETFSPTMWTLDARLGDCDDTARALVALLRSLGFTAGVQTIPPYESRRPPVHVAALVNHGGRWHWLETSIAARPGEHPLEAARRLGIRTRPELGA